ncbi:MAG: zf-TFIIB domain-containing protein [Myxococcales bacterium]|nr:zf-TFIIB domain-containing protein [Myxococcales bacterium]
MQSDTEEPGTAQLVCPRDGAPLRVEKYEANIEVDACPACRGMWLDKGELLAIERSSENDYGKALEERAGTEPRRIADLEQESRRGPIACPKCGGPAEAREYGMASRVTIDTCVDGCGVWLDAGEIQELEEFFERNRGNVTLPLRWRLWASVLRVLKR